MSSLRGKAPLLLCLGIFILVLTACGVPADIDIPLTGIPDETQESPIHTPTAEPPPPKTLIVCLKDEPESLYLYSESYLYGEASLETNAIFQAIYDGPIDILNYEVHPVILDRVPELSIAEDARIEPLAVLEGDTYFNPITYQAENLRSGKTYLPSTCRSMDCAEVYRGEEVVMDQMTVQFNIRPDILWSDGEGLTAHDSVFSFDLDQNADTPTTKYLVDRTFSYEATDDLTIRWRGIPGFLDAEYQTLFWSPLPKHQLGDFSAFELARLEGAARKPLGWGPYVIEEWTAGKNILLTKNENYFRGSEGLPKFDRLVFRFLGTDSTAAIQQLLTGECDILDESLLDSPSLQILTQYSDEGRIQLSVIPGAVIERLDFNSSPSSSDQAAIFSDASTRSAIAGCIDRGGIIDALWGGLSVAPDSYIGIGNPLYASGLAQIPFDPESAILALDEMGWRISPDSDTTIRTSQGVTGLRNGTALSFTLFIAGGDFREEMVDRIQGDLAGCGIEASIEILDPASLTEPWPDGDVFGRNFGMVGWSWPDWITPLCEMFSPSDIPSGDNPYGINVSGFNDAEYQAACEDVLLGIPDTSGYEDAVFQTQEIFRAALPALPLFHHPRFVASRINICGVSVDALSFSNFWAIESYGADEDC
ncbi:MAG: ABC transporter substrate-binding protein [Anaerolineales bacterium]